jgi:hypothetical protein
MASKPPSATPRSQRGTDRACALPVQDLAAFAYARKIGNLDDERFTQIGEHLENCERCQKHLSLLYATDPFLADQQLPPLRFLEPHHVSKQALIAKVAQVAESAAKGHDPRVTALARQSLRELLLTDDEQDSAGVVP